MNFLFPSIQHRDRIPSFDIDEMGNDVLVDQSLQYAKDSLEVVSRIDEDASEQRFDHISQLLRTQHRQPCNEYGGKGVPWEEKSSTSYPAKSLRTRSPPSASQRA